MIYFRQTLEKNKKIAILFFFYVCYPTPSFINWFGNLLILFGKIWCFLSHITATAANLNRDWPPWLYAGDIKVLKCVHKHIVHSLYPHSHNRWDDCPTQPMRDQERPMGSDPNFFFFCTNCSKFESLKSQKITYEEYNLILYNSSWWHHHSLQLI